MKPCMFDLVQYFFRLPHTIYTPPLTVTASSGTFWGIDNNPRQSVAESIINNLASEGIVDSRVSEVQQKGNRDTSNYRLEVRTLVRNVRSRLSRQAKSFSSILVYASTFCRCQLSCEFERADRALPLYWCT